MGDKMTPIPFHQLIHWMITEKKESGKIFGVRRAYKKNTEKMLPIFSEKLETPFGPAAGPNTQLAQNLAAAYYAGSRFFELKTVQVIDGEDLLVNKPCILAEDECYNCEWSTELTVSQAFDEYVKGWFLLNILAKEYELGDSSGFVFNMSVGYDFLGILSGKIDQFIEGLKNAEHTPIFRECKAYLLANLCLFERIDKEFIGQISPNICSSVTLSTLHGCPSNEIEKIARYLLDEKRLHTYIKCNPTLLGYEEARSIMDRMGYDYVVFGEFHFQNDLSFEEVYPMICRLISLANDLNLEFGLKVSNTFPVEVTKKELPSEEMYLSGKALYALSLHVAKKLANAFEGRLRISYSGGADYFNIDLLFDAGIWPITMATTLLKPGGYQRLSQIAEKLELLPYHTFQKVNLGKLEKLCQQVFSDKHHVKAVKPLPNRKIKKKVPLLDCFVAPCKEGCPIRQDISEYIGLVGEGRNKEALLLILEKNPLPFITGSICNHRCMNHCTRNFYESSVQIRELKLIAAKEGFTAALKEVKQEAEIGKKAAIVGGGPAGMAAAYFLARAGIHVTIFEKREAIGGVVRHIIPSFRISEQAVEWDAAFLKQLGVEIRLHTQITTLDLLKKEGFDWIILAVGASKHGQVHLTNGKAMNGLEFLETWKKNPDSLFIGKTVAVIGGGNSAMDVARAAKRIKGVEEVFLVYRRDKKNMPADEEELRLAMEDGVIVKERLSPVSFEHEELLCQKMILGTMGEDGRRSPVATKEIVKIPANTVIAAVGEGILTEFYQGLGLKTEENGKVKVNLDTLQSSLDEVYVIGDGLNGPATVVEGIRDAFSAASAILGSITQSEQVLEINPNAAADRKGILLEVQEGAKESKRCLLCSDICECCVDVCPNRANVAIKGNGKGSMQIIHIDKMCNECGNCKVFCPYTSAPYQDKFTLFWDLPSFFSSTNSGFALSQKGQLNKVMVRLLGEQGEYNLSDANCDLPEEIKALILSIAKYYSYLI